ncbi:MAG: cyclase family protein [Bryobacterales bacterium]|nr:cyclase family protein [Acidobacteriota bacterium]MCB9383509.1 cyclase family protein [Bryobacterales bacterium]
MSLIEQLAQAEVFDLSQPYYVGMPHHPAHPPFLYGLTKRHGDICFADGGSSAAESIALGSHVGTHIDALAHFSKDGKLHGGVEVEPVQSYGGGLGRHGVETIPPIVRRGVLLDVAGARGVEILPEDASLGPAELEDVAGKQGVEIHKGDIVLVRTGWGTLWDDCRAYINGVKSPGPNMEAAQWLSAKGIWAGGSDTVAFEFVPTHSMPVHIHFLVESGIHIIEALDLEGLAKARRYEFAFIAAPLKIAGGTGAPVRPLALVER